MDLNPREMLAQAYDRLQRVGAILDRARASRNPTYIYAAEKVWAIANDQYNEALVLARANGVEYDPGMSS